MHSFVLATKAPLWLPSFHCREVFAAALYSFLKFSYLLRRKASERVYRLVNRCVRRLSLPPTKIPAVVIPEARSSAGRELRAHKAAICNTIKAYPIKSARWVLWKATRFVAGAVEKWVDHVNASKISPQLQLREVLNMEDDILEGIRHCHSLEKSSLVWKLPVWECSAYTRKMQQLALASWCRSAMVGSRGVKECKNQVEHNSGDVQPLVKNCCDQLGAYLSNLCGI